MEAVGKTQKHNVWAGERSGEHDTAATEGWWHSRLGRSRDHSRLGRGEKLAFGICERCDKETIIHYSSACVLNQQGLN